VLVVAVAGGAYWKLALAPKRQEAADLRQKIDVAQAEIAQARATLATYKKSQESYRDNYDTVVRLGKAVPADDDTRSLLVQLDATAKRAGVSFANIDVTQAAGTGGSVATDSAHAGPVIPGAVNAGSFSQMPLTFGFAGDFDGLSNFFGRLERFVTVNGDSVQVNGRLLRIDTIDLKPGEGGWPAIQAQVGASTYIVPDTGATAQGPAGATTTTTSSGTATATSSSAATSTSTSETAQAR
jgi:hypothetical protein